MENNNKPELITTEAEALAPESYDFEFITFVLGLVPICNGDVAINLANIASIERAEDGNGWILTLINDQEYTLTEDDMANLDQLLKGRKAKRKDVIKDEVVAQLQAQSEIQGGVQPVPGALVNARGKRGFH